MKRRITAILSFTLFIVLFFTLSSCGYSEADIEKAKKEAYQAAYESGYEDGHVEGYEEGYSDGKIDGLYDGLLYDYDSGSSNADVDDVLEQADSFAYQETGRDVYEAWNDIMIYIDNSGARNDLAKNAETLMYYCMFLDEYGSYYESDFTDIFE